MKTRIITLLILSLTVFSKIFAQIKFKYSIENTERVSKRYSTIPTVYKLDIKEVETPLYTLKGKSGTRKDTIYVINGTLDLKTYSGTLEKHDAYNKIPYQSQLKPYFQKGTLVPNKVYNKCAENYNEVLSEAYKDKSIVENMKLKPKHEFDGVLVYRDIETNQLYQSRNISDFGIDMRIINFEKKLKPKGYKLTQKGEDYTLTTPNGYDLTLTSDIYKNVQDGNINYINQVVSSVKKYKSYASKYESKVLVLDNLNKEYSSRLIAGNLNESFLNKFRLAVEKEKKEHNALAELIGYKDNEYNFLLHFSNETINNKLRITNMINKCSNRLN